MNLASLLLQSARLGAQRPAVFVGGEEMLSYGELCSRSGQLAGGLQRQYRLGRGSRVAVVADNCAEYLEILFACWWAGLVAVPISARLHPRELSYLFDNAGVSVCFTHSTTAATVKQAAQDSASAPALIDIQGRDYQKLLCADAAALLNVDSKAAAWLFYTSGTTGRPKGACLSHRNLMSMILSFLASVDLVSHRDRWLHAAPMSHGGGLYSLAYVARGGAQVIPESHGFDPDEIALMLKTHPSLSGFFVPTMVNRMVRECPASALRGPSLRTVIYGGAPMYIEDCLAAIDAMGDKLVQIYGQGESPMTITVLSREDHKDDGSPDYAERLGSVGHAQLGVDVAVVNCRGQHLDVGDIGEVVVRGDVVMSGYWENPTATSEAIRDGWLNTGDIGVFDSNGYLTLKDRSKDMIISGGYNIYPREIEEILLRHPSVSEVAVIGRPSSEWGEEVVAFIVAKTHRHAIAEELDAICLQNIARHKRPKHYELVDSLPKSGIGKVLKTSLADQMTCKSTEHRKEHNT